MKILIIGGAGFLGSEVTFQLLNLGHQCVVFDNLSTGRKHFVDDRAIFIRGDILVSSSLSQCISSLNPDVVIHLAAIHHIPTCEKFPQDALATNLVGTANIIEVLKKNNFRGRFGFASTGAVYQDQGNKPLSENDPVSPVGVYAKSKLWCEVMLNDYSSSRKENFSISIFRLFNIIGKNETNDHLIPSILNQLASGSSVLKHGNLEPCRDYVHVSDVARALSLWVSSRDDGGSTYNISSGVEYSVAEVIDECRQVTGSHVDLVLDLNRVRSNDRLHQKGDNTLFAEKYSWGTTKFLSDGIKDLWNQIKSGKWEIK